MIEEIKKRKDIFSCRHTSTFFYPRYEQGILDLEGIEGEGDIYKTLAARGRAFG